MSRTVKYTFNLDRRSGKDRRQPYRLNGQNAFGAGRRRNVRRRQDQHAIYSPDRYGTLLFGTIVAILFLSVIDAYLTIFLTGHGAVELNPLMAFYLGVGPKVFMFAKYGLTCCSVFVLLLLGNFVFPGLKVQTRSIFSLILTVFASVVIWEVYLIIRHVP